MLIESNLAISSSVLFILGRILGVGVARCVSQRRSGAAKLAKFHFRAELLEKIPAAVSERKTLASLLQDTNPTRRCSACLR